MMENSKISIKGLRPDFFFATEGEAIIQIKKGYLSSTFNQKDTGKSPVEPHPSAWPWL